jgi:hypothetical protein
MAQPSATPIECYYGVVHAQELGYGRMLDSFARLGMGRLGEPARVSDPRAPLPDTHQFIVSLPPRVGPRPAPDPSHGSTAADGVTPLDADSRPAYRPVWDILIGP